MKRPPKKIQFGLRLTEHQRHKLDAYAFARDMSSSQVLSRYIDRLPSSKRAEAEDIEELIQDEFASDSDLGWYEQFRSY